jgi:transglutaminase-like putative cysteine protease
MATANINFLAQRQAVIWLLLAQLAALVPQLGVLPVWILVVWACVAYWYWRIVTSAWSFPKAWIKACLSLSTIAGVYFSFTSLFSLEAMVSILVLAVILKLLELKTARDHWLILMLSYFIVACGLLFSQQIGALIFALLQITVLLLAQQALQRRDAKTLPMLRMVGVMALQSLPLMLVLFFIFPRIGPLWTMPLPSAQGTTGMSDSLEFGDIARLSQSGALAFRVRFNGPMPATEELYWRGIVLDDFDGRRWTRSSWSLWSNKMPSPVVAEPKLDYTVTLEPGTHKWLYALPLAAVRRDDVFYSKQHLWLARRQLTGRLQYSASSSFNSGLADENAVARKNLSLGRSANPRAQVLAAQWQERWSEPKERVAAAIEYFKQSSFSYTLTPPLLGENNVDEFLFDTRQGFCEHFAGSFVYLMRAAGVPARIVAGYQGGEFNERDGYLLVNQSDAHAWAEVYIEGQGWQRVDPTATVAPNRIRLGAEASLRNQAGYLGESTLSLRKYDWAKRLRYFVDNINYAWARWVLNFDSSTQNDFLLRVLGDINPQRLMIVIMMAGGIPLALAAFFSLRLPRRAGEDLAARYYLASCAALMRKGMVRRGGETPDDFARRVEIEAPCWGAWLREQTRLFSVCSYLPENSTAYQANLQSLKRARRPQKWLGRSNKETGKTSK